MLRRLLITAAAGTLVLGAAACAEEEEDTDVVTTEETGVEEDAVEEDTVEEDAVEDDLVEDGAVEGERFEEVGEAIGDPNGGLLPGDTYGDNPTLDALWDDCEDGDGSACDELYMTSEFGSEYEEFGDTCGGRFDAGMVWCDEEELD